MGRRCVSSLLTLTHIFTCMHAHAASTWAPYLSDAAVLALEREPQR